MNIEEVREYALSLSCVTEDLFAGTWISFRVKGKWFMLMQLDAPEPRVAVKLPPEDGQWLRDHYDGITAAFHMNKMHWNDLYLEQLSKELICEQIKKSYLIVVKRLPKSLRDNILSEE
jgi:predicted DNA-binding protein (MmcQ/YjbR family)